MRKIVIAIILGYMGLYLFPSITLASFGAKSSGGTATDVSCTDCVTLGTETTGNYAGSSSEGGAATTATALAANGTNCSSGSAPLGVDASGNSENCTAYTTANNAITGATKTKITYDTKGLVTSGTDATTSDIAEGSNLYFTNVRVNNWTDYLRTKVFQDELYGSQNSYAPYFDGDGDFVNIPDPAGGELDFGTGDFSACFWMEPVDSVNPSSNRHILGKDSNNGGDSYTGWFFQALSYGYGIYSVKFCTRNVSSGSGPNTCLESTPSYPVNNFVEGSGFADVSIWNHVCGTRTSNVLRLYINGILDGSTATEGSATNVSNAVAMRIGAFDQLTNIGNTWLGKLDQVLVYNTALSSGNVTTIYNSHNGTYSVPTTNLVGRWECNEGTGTTCDDVSSNSNTGTFNGNTKWTNGILPAAVAGDVQTYNGSRVWTTPTKESKSADCSGSGCTATATCTSGYKVIYCVTDDQTNTCDTNPVLCNGYGTVGGASCSVTENSAFDLASVYAVCSNT